MNGGQMPDEARETEQSLPKQAPQPNGPRTLQRVPSGIKGLDTILNGGFLRGGIYFITGQPGAGKTILSNHMAFNHVASGGRVVFASLLTEVHDRLFSQLRSFSFFKPEVIGENLYYVSAYATMQREGLEGLLKLLHGVVRNNKATLLILDGALDAGAVARTDSHFKEFIQKLQLFAEGYGCTTLMLNTIVGGPSSADFITGRTTVDGIIHLSDKLVGVRAVRELHVQKFRGTSYLEGLHALRIADDGIEVYPRLETIIRDADRDLDTASRERLSTGVAGFDKLLHGGLLAGSSTVLLGPPGSGKTLLGLHFLAEGARHGERGLYFGLNESPALTVDSGDQVGLKLRELVDQELIQVMWQPALEESLDVIANTLLTAVRKGKPQRLFLDGLDALDAANVNSERTPLYFTALMTELHRLGVTTISAIELNSIFGPSTDIPIEGLSARVDNIVFVRYVEIRSELQRIISILKTRRTGHDGAITEFQITDDGIKTGGKFEGAEAILTGVARTLL
jgi:circadian clock protein KaiC